MKLVSILILFFTFLNCSNVLEEGDRAENPSLEWVIVPQTTDTSANVLWKCNTSVEGYLRYQTIDGRESWMTSFLPSDMHILTIAGLPSNNIVGYQVFCGLKESGIGPLLSFTTNSNLSDIWLRSLWVVGGTGSNKEFISDIDVYDPIEKRWYPNVARIPTPRSNSHIVSHNNKIYIIGGILQNGANLSTTNIVEVYDPFENTWQTLNPMPSPLQGGVVGSIGDSIYLIAGSTTTDMTTGTIFDNVFRLQPEIGTAGTWSNYSSSTAIFPRVDMAFCSYEGSIYFTGGRFYQNGNPQATSDAYIPSANSNTGKIEASISLARHGSASACYRPSPNDPASGDPSTMFVAGGSTSVDITQPVSSNIPTNRFEFSILGTQSNSFTVGSNIPESLYYPAMEVSYKLRKLFLMGGATEINLPVATMYSLDLSNPTANSWIPLETNMPKARYGHRIVILNR